MFRQHSNQVTVTDISCMPPPTPTSYHESGLSPAFRHGWPLFVASLMPELALPALPCPFLGPGKTRERLSCWGRKGETPGYLPRHNVRGRWRGGSPLRLSHPRTILRASLRRRPSIRTCPYLWPLSASDTCMLRQTLLCPALFRGLSAELDFGPSAVLRTSRTVLVHPLPSASLLHKPFRL